MKIIISNEVYFKITNYTQKVKKKSGNSLNGME